MQPSASLLVDALGFFCFLLAFISLSAWLQLLGTPFVFILLPELSSPHTPLFKHLRFSALPQGNQTSLMSQSSPQIYSHPSCLYYLDSYKIFLLLISQLHQMTRCLKAIFTLLCHRFLIQCSFLLFPYPLIVYNNELRIYYILVDLYMNLYVRGYMCIYADMQVSHKLFVITRGSIR